MKKIVCIFLTVFYLIPSIGFSMNVHWCGNKSFILFDTSHGKCPCGKKMPMKCCKDVHSYVKLQTNQNTTTQVIVPSTDFVKHFLFFSAPALFFTENSRFDFSNYHAPPFKTKQPAYISNRIFRI